jgi:hypothetical protein
VARLPGQHKGQGLTKAFTPFGLAYWFDPDNDGYGYLTNDLGATRYPISYIFGIAVPRSEPRGVDTQDQGRPPDVPTAALGSKIKAIYGIDRTPGDIFFGPRASASQNVLYVGRGFGEGPCDSLLQVQRGGDRADMLFFGFWTGYATWTFYPGVDSPPAADPSFVAVTGESAATFERYPGLCYVSETYTFQPDIMPGFPDVLFVIKGRKLYDPRKDSTNGGVGPHRFTDPTTWEWSDNAELVYADYRTNPYFGRGTPFAMIDWKAVRENANYCDEQMADGRKRFTINTTLGREADHDSNEDFLRSHFRASRWFMAGGKFTHYIDRPAYSVATFDEGINCAVGRRGRRKTTEVPRGVRYGWIDPTRDYQPATAVEPKDTSLNSSDPRIADYNGEGCRNPGQADSQAVYLYKKRQLDEYVTGLIVPRWEGMGRRIGDVVTLNIPSLGRINYLARIIQVTRTLTGKFFFDLEPYDVNLFVDSVKSLETRPSSNLPNPNAAPPAPGLALAEDFETSGDIAASVIVATVTPPTSYPYYDHTRVTVTPLGQPTYVLPDTVSGGALRIRTILGILQYTVVAVAVSLAGVASASTTQVITCTDPDPSECPIFGQNGSTENERLLTFAFDIDGVTPNTPVLQFQPPQRRTRVLYGSGAWSHTGMTSFDASVVNNGSTGAVAGVITNGDILKVDLGSAKTLREARMSVQALSSVHANIIDRIGHSDDGISFTFHFTGNSAPQGYVGATDTFTEYVRAWSDFGAHRYWSFRFAIDVAGGETSPVTLTEFQVHEFTGAHPFISRYELYDMVTGAPILARTLPARGDYDVASPIDLTSFVHVSNPATNAHLIALRVISVNSKGTPSAPLDIFARWNYGTGTYASAKASVSGVETIRNKTLDDTNSATFKDNAFTLENAIDVTKKSVFDLSLLTTGTTRNYKLPNANAKIAAQDIDNAFSVDQTFNGKVGIGVAAAQPLHVKSPSGDNIFRMDTPSKAAGILKLYDASGDVAIQTNSTADALRISDAGAVNVSSRAIEVNGYRLQQFNVTIFNNGGTLQHRVITSNTDNSTVGNYAGKISGASATLTNTPSLDSTHDFTNGGGVSAGNTSIFEFNTAAQASGEFIPIAVIAINSTATALTVAPLQFSENVNGTTRRRFALQFRNATTAAVYALTAANIPNSAQIDVHVVGFIL